MSEKRDYIAERRAAILEALVLKAQKDPVLSASLSKAAKARVAMDEAIEAIGERVQGMRIEFQWPEDKIPKVGQVNSSEILDVLANDPQFLDSFGASRIIQ